METPLEAIKKCFELHLKPAWSQLDPQKIRKERFWREETDITLKRLEPILKVLYDQNSGRYSSNRKTNNFMSVDEFCGLIEYANCFSD